MYDAKLLSRHYSIKSNINLSFKYDDNMSKNITLRLGDDITVVLYDENNKLKKISGIIVDIINKKVMGISNFRGNQQVGNGGYDLVFKVDTSTTRYPDVKEINLIDIYKIYFGDEDEDYVDPDPIIPHPDPIEPTEPVNPDKKYKITAETNKGTVDVNAFEVCENDTAIITINYDDVYSRLYSLKINDDVYVYNKKVGVFSPTLPTNIGISESLPKHMPIDYIFATTQDSNGNDINVELDFEGLDEDDSTLILTGTITVKIVGVKSNYNVSVQLLTDKEISEL